MLEHIKKSKVKEQIFLIVTILSFHFPAMSSEHEHTTNHPVTWWSVLVESDLLNVIILAAVFIYLGNKFLPKIIDERKNQIKKELEDAKLAKLKAKEGLEQVEEKVRNVESEIAKVHEEAKQMADTIKEQIEIETEKELEELKQKISREITSKQEEAIQNIKNSAIQAAIKVAEDRISKVSKDEEVQKKLVHGFLENIK